MKANIKNKNILLLVSITIGLLIFNLYPQIDLIFANYFYNFNTKTFYLKNNWWFVSFMHVYVKYSIIAFMIISYAFLFYKKDSSKIILLSLLNVALIPLVISCLKKYSSHACPWDLKIYGGDKILVNWWQYAPNVFGQCFPAGHASTGLCIMGLSVVFFATNNIKVGKIFYISGILIGLILGISQQARGAHFVSHTLASVVIACIITNIFIYISSKIKIN